MDAFIAGRLSRASPLPPITAVVNAHHAATETDGVRDGVRRGQRWLPFQGGHYLKTLLLLGRLNDEQEGALTRLYRTRESFALGLLALLQADELLYAGRHRDLILATFFKRGIQPVQNRGTGTDAQVCVDVSSGQRGGRNETE